MSGRRVARSRRRFITDILRLIIFLGLAGTAIWFAFHDEFWSKATFYMVLAIAVDAGGRP